MKTPVLFWTIIVLAGIGGFALFQTFAPENDVDEPTPAPIVLRGARPAGMIEASGPIIADETGLYLEIPMPWETAVALAPGTLGEVRVEGDPEAYLARFAGVKENAPPLPGPHLMVLVRFHLDPDHGPEAPGAGTIRLKPVFVPVVAARGPKVLLCQGHAP